MSGILGIDTSNYTTSLAFFDGVNMLRQQLPLPVKPGEIGLRQSDAVFHHTTQLPQVFECLSKQADLSDIKAVAVSYAPRSADGSYMPCFLPGEGLGRCISAFSGKPLYRFSHQENHIAAALYSANRLEMLNKEFIAFHVSGGTTEAVLVTPDSKNVISVRLLTASSDLKAGQLIDRTGKLLGFVFPAGPALDALARESSEQFKIKIKSSGVFSLSGMENKCRAMLEGGADRCDVARYCIDGIAAVLEAMIAACKQKAGDLPLVFSGGVMSNSIISAYFAKKYGAVFAQPSFSTDNAAGLCILAAIKEKMI